MVKEANEIELMGIYLTANDFLVENTLFIESATASYISRMFTKSEEVEETVEEKIEPEQNTERKSLFGNLKRPTND